MERKNEIQIFNKPEFGDVRVLLSPAGEPWFCAADVCKALGYTNGRKAVADHVEGDDVTKRDTIDSLGRKQSATFTNESGLYCLIFGSKLEKAKEFKKWVTSEVLPTIRKHGGYIQSKEDESTEEFLARALMIANESLRKRDERLRNLQDENSRQAKTIKVQQEKIEENAQKVLFTDAIIGSDSSCLVGELAKLLTQNGYKVGQNRLFKWFREHGYFGSHGERYNIPNQQYVEMGLFDLKKSVHSENGVLKTSVTPKVTGKGQQYFINKFLRK